MFFYVMYVADVYVVLAERKLTSYVYAVGKQPTGNLWYGDGGAWQDKLWNVGMSAATCFVRL